MQYLALCLYCRNENSYLNEWLRYHFSIGVNHVIIYDNRSTVPIRSTIAELTIPQHLISIIEDKKGEQGRQCRAYVDCLRRFAREYQWIGFIDTDEFLVPKDRNDLPALLSEYEHYAALGVYWYCFGSNGHQNRPPMVTSSFTKRSKAGFHANAHIKSIVNTAFVLSLPSKNPHCFNYSPGFSCVDENFRELSGAKGRHTSRRIQLNHYLLRSKEEWEEKMRRGQGNSVTSKSRDFFEDYDAECNEVDDHEILNVIDRQQSFREINRG